MFNLKIQIIMHMGVVLIIGIGYPLQLALLPRRILSLKVNLAIHPLEESLQPHLEIWKVLTCYVKERLRDSKFRLKISYSIQFNSIH
jgi:hypothetical protein